ncbi:MAG: ATP-dependent sacrificial sulfur transferase LarE [Candidatus Tectomicrobia bacterium]|uniref:ATP-dependent sacrificial sulfur transferase LarE n=1 Tax=Tectimicrobiota bacterium TaxID=2528274 RepID=A0A932ZUS1_UNCTE|nr:ATP-dependent sacrificial sulfur transferase LarE [Candidatus Tectomicrobia bacterium]
MNAALLEEKTRRLEDILRGAEGVLVAFSAGADSTLLASMAHRVLGPRALAVTGRSVTLARAELEEAVELARLIGIRHRIVDTEEIQDPSFGNNPPNRCYFCKSELYGVLRQVAEEEGLPVVADGSNADDLGDHRPGMRAAREREVRSPLMEAGLTKAEIRHLSRELGLPTWDKPAQACLSSRFPYGDRITPEKIAQVERAEAALRALGFRQLRVRHHGTIARLELPREEIPALFAKGLSEEVVRRVKEAGFHYVALDLEGFRSGSMNEVLRAPGRPDLLVLP